jgi:hypothetical protein
LRLELENEEQYDEELDDEVEEDTEWYEQPRVFEWWLWLWLWLWRLCRSGFEWLDGLEVSKW